MAKTLRTSGDYTIKAGDGYNAAAGTNTVTIDSKTVTITGDLTVAGGTQTINTTNTVIADNIIELNNGISSSNNDAGIIIERGTTGNNAGIVWDESADSFVLGLTTATGADKSGGISITPTSVSTGSWTATGVNITGAMSALGTSTIDNLTFNDNIIGTSSNADLILSPGGNVLAGAIRINGSTLSADDSTRITIAETTDITEDLNVSGALTMTGSFNQAIHTFTVTDAITQPEHSGRTLLLGGDGSTALTLTLPDATGSGNTYHFIVSVATEGEYKIQVPDADNTITGTVNYLDLDGTAVSAFGTSTTSDTITLNSGTKGGQIGDTLTLIDIAANVFAVTGMMRVPTGANPATPFSAAVS